MIGLRRKRVKLVPYQPDWASLGAQACRNIRRAAGDLLKDVQHVGSTSVPDLPAKPILDIAAGIATEESSASEEVVLELRQRLTDIGYIYRGDNGDEGGHLFVMEAAPEVRTIHLHVVEHEGAQWRNYLCFRDLLRSDPKVRDRYAALKQDLMRHFPNDRRSYTAGKHEFIQSTLQRHAVEVTDGQQCLEAGVFSSWLRSTRVALLSETGINVNCGACFACCSSSYFIHVRPDEIATLAAIPGGLLVAAPGLPKGHTLMGYDKMGLCPMLKEGKCSIYDRRPRTCRNYDCRVFAAAGIPAGGIDKVRITQQAERWRFSYPTPLDLEEHKAVRATARFIKEHAADFPGGAVPIDPSQLAIVAIKAYEALLNTAEPGNKVQNIAIATAIVETCRKFDANLKK